MADGIVDMRGSVSVHGTQKPTRIILHTTESEGDPRGIPGFWQSQGKGYGSQYAIGRDGTIVQFANDTELTYHTGGANTGSVGIEIVGFAKWTREEWLQHPEQLRAIARLVAQLGKRHNIPITLNLGRGVGTHAMASDKYEASEGHWDPGPGFPLNEVLTQARTIAPDLATLPLDTSGDTSPTDDGTQSFNDAPAGQAAADQIAQEETQQTQPQQLFPEVVIPPVTDPSAIVIPGTPEIGYTPRRPVAETWRLIAGQPFASPDTLEALKAAELADGF